MNSFYSDPENLVDILHHYLAVFSEGHQPVVVLYRKDDGSVNVDKTLTDSIYSEFPASEKLHWLQSSLTK